ncbi:MULTISPECIES: type II toxin-antitoxin system RelB/DinJ family antitoxin [Bifidobacterium]|jgi:DNA-damage-inducible protein J|uniref:Type II toxin-antitoxin system RelB/DinJ family antitoxin n=1 Tax=Bifidobacterium tibiigranuli TaxID=2172043 RepID=A0A5N6S4W6_9BIFI|nr:type II toxin-antitoxin system RelB/DinJ family antitoxin [Bifidobacterium tibiigranuli]KAE8128325.1 type II toxin-antitoxin system RelB/DinJ family antitoxin [Bifidobacterium tibiigranuli]KAE8128660.1 type II toxin-antitoxin system antitoxin, RelB/DinJ family [Bifidobacterium tibiigranuli]MCI1210866.1 type II toxin-antitoxin system RelB/DinJ family antitoxin [Bifidobacterium tibiigranuli]MCI1221636.1 type II toxin-antitoxin system RelB/DinJ family antitoxin [Bifidobacterium tibiigranuli]MC
MSMTSVTVRLDEATKRDASAVAEKLGTDLSAATRMFYKQIIREQGIPLDLHLAETPNAETIQAINDGRKALSDGEPGHSTPDALFASIGI